MDRPNPDPNPPAQAPARGGTVAKFDVQALLETGIRDMEGGRLSAAVDAFERANRSDPTNPWPFYHLGIAKARGGDLEGALTNLYAATWLRADFAEALNELGLVKLRLKDFAGAVQYFMRAAEASPRRADYHANIGYAALEQEDYPLAIQAYDLAIRVAPDSGLHLGRGNARRLIGDHKGAIEDFGRAIELNPREARAMLN